EPELAFELESPGEGAFVLAIRHPSGAVSFHPPESLRSIRRGAKNVPTVRFRVPLRGSSVQSVRRGLIGRGIRAVVFKVAAGIAARALPPLVRAWEQRAWSDAGRHEGWYQVTPEALRSGSLTAATPPPGKRCLVFMHGTFSHAASAFRELAASDFFTRLAPKYTSRIFAFNHFTVSRTPAENARMLLEALEPGAAYEFDIVSHSRGGLVARTLVEDQDQLGASGGRVQVDKLVLVASPNEGTPLATADRWQELLNWVSNLLEV